MSDKPAIVIGLVIALVVLTVPFWYAPLAAGRADDAPEFTLEGQCVEDAEFMKAHHMDLLDEWRDDVVRKGKKTYESKNLGEIDMSLTKTCMSCHVSRDDFCKKCHDYADVRPTCWDCHVESLGK